MNIVINKVFIRYILSCGPRIFTTSVLANLAPLTHFTSGFGADPLSRRIRIPGQNPCQKWAFVYFDSFPVK